MKDEENFMFLLFCFDYTHREGGMNDLCGKFNTLEEAISYHQRDNLARNLDCAQIYDTISGKLLDFYDGTWDYVSSEDI